MVAGKRFAFVHRNFGDCGNNYGNYDQNGESERQRNSFDWIPGRNFYSNVEINRTSFDRFFFSFW